MVVHPHWRRKRSSAKTRGTVLWALRGGIEMNPHELAAETGLRWRWVCAALDDLAIHGQVERVGESSKYRRTDAEEKKAS